METQRQKFGVPYDVKQRLMVYKIPGCQYCNHLESLFKRCSKPMIVDGIYYSILYINVGTGVSVDWFTSTYTNAPGYPWVVLADEDKNDIKEIGGLVETARFLLELGLVSSKNGNK